jgi:DNA transformation protein
MLYALQGALMDVHWNDIPPDLKARLVSEAELPDQGNFSQATA